MNWQDIIALVIVAACVFYVARVTRRSMAGRGGCCDKPCGVAEQKPLVQINLGTPQAMNRQAAERSATAERRDARG